MGTGWLRKATDVNLATGQFCQLTSNYFGDWGNIPQVFKILARKLRKQRTEQR
jgi:hypothetical protein